MQKRPEFVNVGVAGPVWESRSARRGHEDPLFSLPFHFRTSVRDDLWLQTSGTSSLIRSSKPLDGQRRTLSRDLVTALALVEGI